MDRKHSSTAFLLPGRLIMSDPLRMPQTARDRTANLVFSKLLSPINKASCGASFSMTRFVASGVTSRGANPVPPLVKITLINSVSVNWSRAACIRGMPDCNYHVKSRGKCTDLDLLDFIRNQFVSNILDAELVIDQFLQMRSTQVHSLPAGTRVTHGNHSTSYIAHFPKSTTVQQKSNSAEALNLLPHPVSAEHFPMHGTAHP